jgi:acetyl-CoA/propionyl-CoA carboxylase, biotin carboxylase, biotin carboxyl carrier protein
VAVGDGPVAPGRAVPDGEYLEVSYDGVSRRYLLARDGETVWLGREGLAWSLSPLSVAAAGLGGAGGEDGVVRSPMPGSVVAVKVSEGEPVTAGQPLLVVEAMKMEHTLAAPVDGVVSRLLVTAGQQVSMDETVAVVELGGES